MKKWNVTGLIIFSEIYLFITFTTLKNHYPDYAMTIKSKIIKPFSMKFKPFFSNYEICVFRSLFQIKNFRPMKKFSLFLLFSMILMFINESHATVWRLNNWNGISAHFTGTLQEAVNAVSDGDTIYVEPSPFDYGEVIIAKKYFHDNKRNVLKLCRSNSGKSGWTIVYWIEEWLI